MSDNQPLLSPEELSALTQAVDDGSMAVDTGYNLDAPPADATGRVLGGLVPAAA